MREVATSYPFSLSTFFARVVLGVQSGKQDMLITILNEILKEDKLVIEHPKRPEILTRCYRSEEIRFGNVLCFADGDGDNRWFWIQTCSLVDGAVIDDVCYQLHGNTFGDNAVANIGYDLLHRIDTAAYFIKPKVFDGALLSHSRPAHFFYDQMLNLPLLPALQDSVISVSETCFFNPALLGYNTQTKAAGWSIRPQTVPANYHVASAFEDQLTSWARNNRVDFPPEAFILWVGVADEKRCWQQQVEGYASLITAIHTKISRQIVVLVDGYTAYAGEEIDVPSEKALFSRLQAEVSVPVQWVSLIGKDYATKLRHGVSMTAFATYIGTQSMLPLRFLKSSGVVHSNGVYGSGLKIAEFPNARRVPFREVKNVQSSVALKGDYVSYHMPWQSLFNAIVDALNLNDVELEFIPSLDIFANEEDTLNEDPFLALGERVSTFRQSADILREVALTYEAVGDFDTALKLMSKALELRPTGKVIISKVEYYRQQIIDSQLEGKN
ncbi:tetratricopeptide repeat protein [uncultured Umboniibacter sp.]|uniref:tetratricopeptide repeat protein n=1 Tax=uncultured Umboniibacter sp. TaxID=1798917 RepID=UPI00260CBA99|nr:tetratricopeptide repeat protein [uncultured Umboniibacter sp.]